MKKRQFDGYVLQCVTTKHLVECGENSILDSHFHALPHKKRDKGLREVTLKNDSIRPKGVDWVEKYNVNFQMFKHALVNLCNLCRFYIRILGVPYLQ